MIEQSISTINKTGDQDIAKHILIINSGSSSIRFAIYQFKQTSLPQLVPILAGKIERIGVKDCQLKVSLPADLSLVSLKVNGSVPAQLFNWLEEQPVFASVTSVGHRIVHGMNHSKPQMITSLLLEELKGITDFAPLHLPLALELIELICQRHRDLPQIACFDTAFHQTMPRVASQLTLPREYETQGLRRYGFHGLSCEYIMHALQQLDDPAATNGRVIIAHLGSGASLTAVKNAKSIDNSMGMTPAGGMMMGSRSGDLDPGVLSYLLRTSQLNAQDFDKLINQKSGLVGVSETSADIRDLLALAASDVRAAEAINLFCYQVCKWIGAFSAALGGLDTLVFAGGIGENAPIIRNQICSGLKFLGIEIEPLANAENAAVISNKNGKTVVRVIHTNEELMIARHVAKLLELTH